MRTTKGAPLSLGVCRITGGRFVLHEPYVTFLGMNLHGDSTVKETDSNEHSTFLPAKNIKPIDIYRGYVPSFLYQKSTEDLPSQAHH